MRVLLIRRDAAFAWFDLACEDERDPPKTIPVTRKVGDGITDEEWYRLNRFTSEGGAVVLAYVHIGLSPRDKRTLAAVTQAFEGEKEIG